MRDCDELEDACERSAKLENRAAKAGTRYPLKTYEEGLRDALDWVCENTSEDPTLPQ